jgi:zinc protease
MLAWPDAIERVTAADIGACLHWLDKRRSVTGYLSGETH